MYGGHIVGFSAFWGSIIGYSSVISLVDGLFKKRLFSAVEYSESVVWAQKMISERDIIGRQTFQKHLFTAVEISESIIWAQKMISERDIIGWRTFQKKSFYCCRALRKCYLSSENDFWGWYHWSTEFSKNAFLLL